MKTFKNLIALTAVMSLFAGQVQGQDYCCDDCSAAYCDSGDACYLSAALPIGALAVAAIIIATTDRHHHSSSCGGSCSSSSSIHAHSSCSGL